MLFSDICLFDLGHCKNLQELNVSDCQSLTVSKTDFSTVVRSKLLTLESQWAQHTLCMHLGLTMEKANYIKHWQKHLPPLYNVIINLVAMCSVLEPLEDGNSLMVT